MSKHKLALLTDLSDTPYPNHFVLLWEVNPEQLREVMYDLATDGMIEHHLIVMVCDLRDKPEVSTDASK